MRGITLRKIVERTIVVATLILGIAVPGRAQLLNTYTTSGPYAYVSNQSGSSVSVIDTPTGYVVATIPIGINCGEICPAPAGLAVTPDGTRVYVAASDGNVYVIATSTNAVATTVALTPICDEDCFPNPIGVAITPDGTRAYVTDNNQDVVQVIDTNPSDDSYNTVLTIIDGTFDSSFRSPWAIAISPNGNAAYVTNFLSDGVADTLDVIDTNPADTEEETYNTNTSTFTVGSNPSGVAFTPNGVYALVTDDGDGTVDVITTADVGGEGSPVTSTITIGENTGPYSVAITPDGTLAYVANQTAGSVSVITIADIGCDDECNPVTATITGVGTTLNQIAITPNGREAFIAAGGSNAAAIIFTATNTTSPSITVGTGPFGVAIGPAPSCPIESVTDCQSALLGAAAQTIIFEFDDNAHSIAYTFPADWCVNTPCLITAGYTDTPESVWTDESSNYPGTTIASIPALNGDGAVYTVTCVDSMSRVCSSPLDYTATLHWQDPLGSELNFCSSGPALGKEETTTWENILGMCSYSPDPGPVVSGHSKPTLSRWAAFSGVTGHSSATITITTPANGGYYLLNQPVNAKYSCGGTFSDCDGTVTNGDPIDTSSLGTKSFTAEANVTSGPTASETVNYNVVACHDVLFEFNPSTVAAGRFSIVTAFVGSCTGMVQKKTTVQFMLTGPLGRACGISSTLAFTTPSFTLEPKAISFVFPLLIPRSACTGTYTVTATTSVSGTVVDSDSSSLIVTAP
ncbi:MAG: YncE family protein [Candidatus Acidiferrales bacterium]